MNRSLFALVLLASTLFVACGKMGSPAAPSDTNLTMSIAPNSVPVGVQATITWFSRAGNCSASGDWSGSKSGAGTQTVGPFTDNGVKHFALTCDNGATSAASLVVGTPTPTTNGDTQTSPDGLVTITIVQRTPSTGPLVPGQPQFLSLHIVNRADIGVSISINVFGGGSTFNPHSETDYTVGNSHGGLSGSVPVIRITGLYGPYFDTTAWTLSFPGW